MKQAADELVTFPSRSVLRMALRLSCARVHTRRGSQRLWLSNRIDLGYLVRMVARETTDGEFLRFSRANAYAPLRIGRDCLRICPARFLLLCRPPVDSRALRGQRDRNQACPTAGSSGSMTAPPNVSVPYRSSSPRDPVNVVDSQPWSA